MIAEGIRVWQIRGRRPVGPGAYESGVAEVGWILSLEGSA